MSDPLLVCTAHPFGYGPAAKLLHVAHRLRLRRFRLAFLGAGIGRELAGRSGLFDDVVAAGPEATRARALVRSAVGLLSLMDRDYAPLALDAGRPLFVADSLLWMRDAVPEPFRRARRYWAQDFPGVRGRLAEVGPAAVRVGPIVGPPPPAPAGRRPRLVINLGGGEGPHGSLADGSGYLDFVASGLLRCDLVRAAGPDAVLLGGAACVRSLRARHGGGELEMISAAHDEALRLLQSARLVLTAPGLTACLECFQAGVPTLFLPPQNYSQWWILRELQARGLAPGSFHWADHSPADRIVPRMPESVRAPLVRDAISCVSGDAGAARLFRDGLEAAAAGDLADLARRQQAFFASLGPDGTGQIVHDLAAVCAADSREGSGCAPDLADADRAG